MVLWMLQSWTASLRQSTLLLSSRRRSCLGVPQNPHSGCFLVVTSCSIGWISRTGWTNSFISPLESAATLGLAKTFRLWKPCFTHASWFELQHWGTSFHSLIPRPEGG